ncbi:MmpS family transport accessory protein [Streptomyces parvulus]|uniref:Uncharacterized protein n=1 Tax=Streptomyces parvulus TaxID=146923 RepID=A0A369UT45_9ACTN|nr:MmpS family transport accessory protein [Streptomyces parvulus]RDD83924.1 hypothetical protein DVZ84_37940 [Streptomyces parvulus]
MKTFQADGFPKLLVTAAALSLTVLPLSGCGMFGASWDVKLEVLGDGGADIGYAFSGDNGGKTERGEALPWSKTQNVGFGFNDVGVADAAPGTSCRIYVDGKLRDEQRGPDADGRLSCSVNLQD